VVVVVVVEVVVGEGVMDGLLFYYTDCFWWHWQFGSSSSDVVVTWDFASSLLGLEVRFKHYFRIKSRVSRVYVAFTYTRLLLSPGGNLSRLVALPKSISTHIQTIPQHNNSVSSPFSYAECMLLLLTTS
jgi:hypothetical protein